jgi:SAM-dependent methyltransferase
MRAPAARAPVELYERALQEDGRLFVRGEDGRARPVPIGRWLGPLTAADRRLLERAVGPVLDVGCGPGRHVGALARRGVMALGVEIAPMAVERARNRGAQALLGSVFDPIPGAGSWRTALLLDGNIGIGGRPTALLQRLAALLCPGGTVLCELSPPGSPTAAELIALEDASGARSSWFPWAHVGVDGITDIALAVPLVLRAVWRDRERWFAELRREPAAR